jgi:hypothetical protein
MNVSAPFIVRPIATTLLIVGVTLLGLVAYFVLPIAGVPQVDIPTLRVTASLPGANAETMATSVAAPLESQLSLISGVTSISSTSSLGQTQIQVEFDLGRSIEGAAQDVQTAISAAGGLLPKNLPNPPTYEKVHLGSGRSPPGWDLNGGDNLDTFKHPRDQRRRDAVVALRFARTCYDHLAGQLSVAIADALIANGHIILTEEGGEVTEAGSRFLTAFGADLTLRSRNRRIFCRPCLDWSERRYHVAGLVGAEILGRCLELDWLIRGRDTRAVRVTSAGRTGLYQTFGLDLSPNAAAISRQNRRSTRPACCASAPS